MNFIIVRAREKLVPGLYIFFHENICHCASSSNFIIYRTGRYARRYDRLTSPLMFLQWWRICLDEGQMVDSAVKHSSQIAKCLASVNRWAVTGTPIQKTVEGEKRYIFIHIYIFKIEF